MKILSNRIKNILKVGILSLSILIFLGGISNADLLDQITEPTMNAKGMFGRNTSHKIGTDFFKGSLEISLDVIHDGKWFEKYTIVTTGENNDKAICGRDKKEECSAGCKEYSQEKIDECREEWRWDFMDNPSIGVELGITRNPSIIVKVTRLLLSLVIALSVTMILYNGMIYIIHTGQGKEGKDLVKNIIYIVVGILISLFSVVIITIIQSVPTTIKYEVKSETKNQTDNGVVEDSDTIFSGIL